MIIADDQHHVGLLGIVCDDRERERGENESRA
jgi:hypothetical protein